MTSIWAKITAFFALIAGIMAVAWKNSADKNRKLERLAKLRERQAEIKREMDATVDKIKRTEVDRIEANTKPDGSSRADRLNSLLNDRDRT